MKLPFLKQKPPPQYYLILLLREERVTAVVFGELEGAVSIIGLSEEYFKEPLNKAKMESWVEVLDKAIGKAEDNLPSSIETHKTLFAVKEDWVEDQKIKKEYLDTLKKVSETLDLQPIGFLVITEALAHYLQRREGAPISAVFVEIAEKYLTATIVRAGKIIESTKTEMLESPAEATDLALKHFENAQVLPSRIIILQEKYHDSFSQQFISHSWSKSLPFLHVPQILTLPDQFDAKAAIYAAATQMGFTPPTEIESFASKKPEESKKENVPPENNSPEKHQEEKMIPTSEESFGFIQNADIKDVEKEEVSKVNIGKESIEEEPAIQKDLQSDSLEEPQLAVKVSSPRKSSSLFSRVVPFLNSFKKLPSQLLSSFGNKTTTPSNAQPRKRIGKRLFALPLLAIPVILFLVYSLFLKATIVIAVKPETLKQEKNVAISALNGNDFAKNQIGGEILSVSESGDVTVTATGKKETGEKAKGSVTLYSRLSQSKTLPSGTVITSSNDLDFTLDKEVSIASSSADASASPSTAKVNVTAVKVGKESNLPSNTKFDVASFTSSEIVAKNDSAFSGGTKIEITVVSQKDQDKALVELEEKLNAKAKESIVKKIPDGKSIVPLFVNATVTKKDFDHKVGAQAKNVTLSGTVNYETISYTGSDIYEYTHFLVKDRLREKTSIDKNISYEIRDVSSKEAKEATGKLVLSARLVPEISEEQLAKDIKGKSFSDAEKIIKDFPQVEDATITTNIPLLIFQLLPNQEENITIVVKNEN